MTNVSYMKSFGAYLLLFLFITINTYTAIGQQEEYIEEEITYISPFVEFGVSIIDPLFNFGRAKSDNIVGFGLSAYQPIGEDDQIYLGIILNYARIDRDVQNNQTFGGEDVNDIANSNMLGLSVGFRYFPEISFLGFDPFVEAQLGARSFYTVTKSFFPESSETTNQDTQDFNVAIGYGFVLGTEYYVSDNTAITLKLNFQLSNIANYYVELEENPQNMFPIDNFSFETSQVDFIAYELGISYLF